MSKYPTRRGYFLCGLGGAVLGALLVGVLLVSMLPVEAATGDPVILGQPNTSGTGITTVRNQALRTLRVVNDANGGIPLVLIGQPKQPPMKVTGAGMVAKLNSDRVDNRHANELIRVAYGSTDNADDSNGTAVSATITAPWPGFLVMAGTIDTRLDPYAGHENFRCLLQVDNSWVVGSMMSSTLDDGGGNHTDNGSDSCTTMGVMPVDAGEHTIEFTIQSSDWTVFLDATVWALYVPFDGTGAVPTP